MHRRRSRRTAPLVAVALAAAALTAVPAAVSFASPASPAAPAVSRTVVAQDRILPVRPYRMPSTITGWRTSARTVAPGHVLRVHVRTTGPRRVVRLERRVHGEWRVLGRMRSSAAGRAALVWRMPRRPGRVALRMHVMHTARYRAVLSEHRVLTVRAARVVVRPLPTATPKPTPSTTTSPSTAPTSADETRRQQLLTLVNAARATPRTCGDTRYAAVPALVRSTPLDTAANDFAVRMATEDFFDHTSPDGKGPGDRLRAVGVTGVAWAENIAAGQADPDAVMASWLKSEGHCANIMSPDVKRVGFGYASSSTAKYGRYWVQDFAG